MTEFLPTAQLGVAELGEMVLGSEGSPNILFVPTEAGFSNPKLVHKAPGLLPHKGLYPSKSLHPKGESFVSD